MRVLLVEDDRSLARVIEVELLLQGMQVDICGTGRAGLANALEGGYDLLILDWMLPDIDGMEVCSALRSRDSKIPIIIITARQGVSNEVRGLQAGADDYIIKPFDMEQLTARVHAVTRRARQAAGGSRVGGPDSGRAPERLTHDGLTVSTAEHAVYENGARIHLTKKEYEILLLLLANKGQVQTREQIRDAVWGENIHMDEGVLAVHIKAIRNKLKGRYIENIRGVGYTIPRDNRPV